MKVYIAVVLGKEPKILGVYRDKKTASDTAYLYALANAVWTDVREYEVQK